MSVLSCAQQIELPDEVSVHVVTDAPKVVQLIYTFVAVQLQDHAVRAAEALGQALLAA